MQTLPISYPPELPVLIVNKDLGCFSQRKIPGVNLCRGAWIASWQKDGKHCSKSFSVEKYGDAEARRLATEARIRAVPTRLEDMVLLSYTEPLNVYDERMAQAKEAQALADWENSLFVITESEMEEVMNYI